LRARLENLVVRRQGKGTFVATHTEEATSLFPLPRIRRNDETSEYPASRVIDLRRSKASAEAARILELKAGDPVHVSAVLEYEESPRAGRNHAACRTLSRNHQGEAHAYQGSMYSFLRDAVRRPDGQGAGEAPRGGGDAASAKLLGLKDGEPLLAVDRVTSTYGGRPVEWRRGLCTTEAHHYFNEIG
jgi:GntR family transcriptional regulator